MGLIPELTYLTEHCCDLVPLIELGVGACLPSLAICIHERRPSPHQNSAGGCESVSPRPQLRMTREKERSGGLGVSPASMKLWVRAWQGRSKDSGHVSAALWREVGACVVVCCDEYGPAT